MNQLSTTFPLTHHRVQIEDTTVAYQVAGDGPPVVLVHGLSGSASWWRYNIDALASHFRVYVVDLLGFGDNRGQPFALSSAGRSLITLLDKLGIERASLVGHSMGGYIVADAAADFPNRVERLVLVDAAVLPFGMVYLQHAQGLLRELGHVRLPFLPVLLRDAWRAGPTTMWRAANEIIRADLREKLATISLPTLIVWGELDALVPVSFGQQLVRDMPHSALVTIGGAGHNAMWDCPAVFNQVAVEFLRGETVTDRERHIDCRSVPRHTRFP